MSTWRDEDTLPNPRDIRANLRQRKVESDGSTASYYELPKGATELQDLISYRDMNHPLGQIMCCVYDYATMGGARKHIDDLLYYANVELKNLLTVRD